MIQYLMLQNRFRTGEHKTIERERERERAREREDVRRYVGDLPVLTELCLVMRIYHLALVRGISEIVTVIYAPMLTFAVPTQR